MCLGPIQYGLTPSLALQRSHVLLCPEASEMGGACPVMVHAVYIVGLIPVKMLAWYLEFIQIHTQVLALYVKILLPQIL